ncbi:hypothetical protein [Sphingopyxis sp.]|uniref:hypothetical protein n=1 Tax=Sphingopyxis sp. TaxID=1908224 RepID=UPI002ED8A628
MYDGHREKRIDTGLRLGGALLGGASSLAVWRLAALHLSGPHPDPGIDALFLAVAAFLCASLGTILLTQGRHIFDRIELGERWRTRLPHDTGGLR